MHSIRLLSGAWPDRPGMDTGVSHALVKAVGAGDQPESLRLHATGPVVAFGRRDTVSDGYRAAIAHARRLDFVPIERLAGGRAAVFHEGTVAFSWAIPTSDPRLGVTERFEELAAIVRAALRVIGVDARIGQIPGEYCPGAHSVNARGRTKLMGVGQRLVRGAAHVGGVIVVNGHDRIRDVLVPVYRALGIPWDPDTVGSIADEVGPIGINEVIAAVRDAFARSHVLISEDVPETLLVEARSLAPEHVASV